MKGPAELVSALLWRLLPDSTRKRIGLFLVNAHARAAIEPPRSTISVFARSDELRKRFAKHIAPIAESRPSYSIICTCYNEASSITAWLDSVASQRHRPSEVVLVDGGSSDDTLLRIRAWNDAQQDAQPAPLPLKVIEERKLNISEGRNRAAAEASHGILAITDAGCELDRFWAERLLEPFGASADTEFSMGYYRPIVGGGFAEAVQRYIAPQLEHIDPETFLPSARSLAVTRERFLQLGGYPEFLTLAGEDSLFDYYLKSDARRGAFVPDALTFWKPPTHLPKLFTTVKNYARGDAEGGRLFWRYYLNLLRSFGKLALEAALLVALSLVRQLTGVWEIVYLEWLISLWILLRYTALVLSYGPFRQRGMFSSQSWWALLAIQFMIWAQVFGFIQGLLSRRAVEKRRRAKATSGEVCVISAAALHRGDETEESKTVRELLASGHFVTFIFAAYQKKQAEPFYEHQFLESYLRSAFVFDVWVEQRRKLGGKGSVRVVDLLKDSFSKELETRFAELR